MTEFNHTRAAVFVAEWHTNSIHRVLRKEEPRRQRGFHRGSTGSSASQVLQGQTSRLHDNVRIDACMGASSYTQSHHLLPNLLFRYPFLRTRYHSHLATTEKEENHLLGQLASTWHAAPFPPPALKHSLFFLLFCNKSNSFSSFFPAGFFLQATQKSGGSCSSYKLGVGGKAVRIILLLLNMLPFLFRFILTLAVGTSIRSSLFFYMSSFNYSTFIAPGLL